VTTVIAAAPLRLFGTHAPCHTRIGTGAVHAIKWAVQRARYMTLETIGALSDDPIVKLPAVAA
jgi:hypothetical protein